MKGFVRVAGVCAALLLPTCGTAGTKVIANVELRSAEHIQTTIDRSRDKFYRAYLARLAARPGLKGRIDFRITIGPKGSVVRSEVGHSTMNDRELEGALNSILSGLDFGSVDSPYETAFTYPMEFYPPQ